MSKFTIIVALFMFSALYSCKKCMNCETRNKKTGKVVDDYPENCGKKESLDTQELTYRYHLPDSLELICTRK